MLCVFAILFLFDFALFCFQGVSKEDLQRAEESLQAANAQRIVAEVAPEKPAASESIDKFSSASTSTTTATTTASSAAAVRSSVAEQRSVR